MQSLAASISADASLSSLDRAAVSDGRWRLGSPKPAPILPSTMPRVAPRRPRLQMPSAPSGERPKRLVAISPTEHRHRWDSMPDADFDAEVDVNLRSVV